MRRHPIPLLEFDPSPEALIEPSRVVKAVDAPERCVICFFQEVIKKLRATGEARVLTRQRSELGEHPVYELDLEGERLAVFHPGIGASLAAAVLLEEIIARGCRKFIACGSAGVLDKDIAVGHIIVPVAAVRDEGTSYHYLAPDREVAANAAAVAAVEATLRRHGCPYLLAKTWTTDAFYRETPARIAARKAEGCLTVEMEASALMAVAEFRGVPFAQMLYGGDDVSGIEWDSRHWHSRTEIREQLFRLAAEACLAL